VVVQDFKVLWMSSRCLSPEPFRTISWHVKKLKHSLWRGTELSRTDPELARAAVVPSRARPSSAILRTRRGLRLELFAVQRLQNDAKSCVVRQERVFCSVVIALEVRRPKVGCVSISSLSSLQIPS
jgi:hypothetical protein